MLEKVCARRSGGLGRGGGWEGSLPKKLILVVLIEMVCYGDEAGIVGGGVGGGEGVD